MKGMILSAGYGTRLKPLTNYLPKPLFPVLNKPLINFSIKLLKNVGIEEIVVNTHYMAEKIENYLKTKDSLIKISYEPKILGTGGGLKKVEPFLKDDTFILINSDIIISIDLNEVINFHKKMGGIATLVLREDANAEKFGVIEIDKDNRITSFIGKEVFKSDKYKKGMFTGIHVIEPEIFKFIPKEEYSCINHDIYPLLFKENIPIYGYFTKSFWSDLGTIKSYLETNFELLNIKSLFEENYKYIKNNTMIIPPVLIGEDVFFSENCIVGPNVILGDRCKLGKNVILKNSVVWEKAVIKDKEEYCGSIITPFLTQHI